MRTDHSFLSSGIRLAAHLYTPDAPNGRALVIGHPGTATKEQSPALYARKLIEKGFTILTFDAAFQGESEGLPRSLEDPAQRIEDIKAAVSYLSTLPGIAPERIGVLGICASGGYAIAAAAGDRRIRAVATVAAVDVGLQMRVGADGQQDKAVLDALLEGAAQARSRAARGEPMGALPVFPANEQEARAGGQHIFEGWDYYCTPRARHPRSAKALSWDSIDRMASFDAFRFVGMIAPRPLLMITAEHAVTAWMSRQAIAQAEEPKTLHTVNRASHVDLYDREGPVNEAVAELARFFHAAL
ncbi:alpha/beta hydrolase [Novosphingobium terrae]|uniref:alpha/beta hydrolase n=1 Tax=Novosphingobium terrae TaxID=2726189 RepID=UPI0019811DDC|nr:alpha/beta hydrolase [Novosphingobium terrae]